MPIAEWKNIPSRIGENKSLKNNCTNFISGNFASFVKKKQEINF